MEFLAPFRPADMASVMPPTRAGLSEHSFISGPYATAATKHRAYLIGIKHPDAMKTVCLFFASLFFGGLCIAQNLVPNGSFEEYTECPTNFAQFDRAIGWSRLSGSPDLLNACDDTDTTGVPSNNIGYQFAANGQGYAGLVTYFPGFPEYREAIIAQLNQPMVVGANYDLSLKVSPGGFSYSVENTIRLASRGIGLRLSTNPVPLNGYALNGAVLFMDNVLQDTLAWTTLSRELIADSAYQFVLIGNFFEDSLSEPTVLDPNGQVDASYAFVDEICISNQDGICATPESISMITPMPFTVLNNPSEGDFRILFEGSRDSPAVATLYDPVGKLCMGARAVGEELVLNTAALAAGQYILRVQKASGSWVVRLIHLIP
jgi:hypothetical protein